MFLSKSDYKVARSCPAKLFYRKKGYPSTNDDDEYLELLAEGGYIVQKMAALLFPEGQELPFLADPTAAHAATITALKSDQATLFEATLISGGKLARVDILEKNANEFHIIEVESTSYDSNENAEAVASGRPNLFRTRRGGAIVAGWREYLEDVAFQVLILRELFPHARIRASLMMPDKSRTTGIDGLISLFRLDRIRIPGTTRERYEVRFTGDVEELRRQHFLTLVSVDAEVDLLADEVREFATQFAGSLKTRIKRIQTPISVACRNCEYRVGSDEQHDGFRDCWGELADAKPHLLDLYQVGSVGGRGGAVANQLIQSKRASLFDVPRGSLVKSDGTVGEVNRRQLIQIDHTQENTEWISDDLPGILRPFPYPLHFIDFETTASAVPYHAGMHPYEPVAFQWSCHTLASPDSKPSHADWINLEEVFPNFAFAETLMRHLGRDGTVFMWASHENSILRRIHAQLRSRDHRNQELASWLRWIIRDRKVKSGRLVDMNQLCLKHYFHPLMKGRTSIKVVSDAIWKSNLDLRNEYPEYLKTANGEILSPYASLPPLEIIGQPLVVSEGTGAIRAYEAMMFGIERDDKETKSVWRDLLRQYCRLDTLAMVWIWRHWNIGPSC